VTGITDAVVDLCHGAVPQGGRFVVLSAPDDAAERLAARRLVLALNTGNRGVAVHWPADAADPADLSRAAAEARRCWGTTLPLARLLPA